MEGKTHFEKIIGGTEEQRAYVLRQIEAALDRRGKHLAPHELEKTPEEIEVLETTEEISNEVVSRYGGNQKRLSINNIFVLKPGSVSELLEGKGVGGLSYSKSFVAGVERNSSMFPFACVAAHESFHLKSFKSVLTEGEREIGELYRSGFSMYKNTKIEDNEDEKTIFFGKLEEAIVAECSKKFAEILWKQPGFKYEFASLQIFRDWVMKYHIRHGASEKELAGLAEEIKYIANAPDIVQQVTKQSDDENERQSLAAEMFKLLELGGKLVMVERRDEREKLYKLLDEIVTSSNGKYSSRDEVFDILATANFSGNYMPAARMIEGTLGRGSFRKLAEDFSTKSTK